MQNNSIVSIILLSIVSFIGVVPIAWSGSYEKVDVYLFYDHERYIENIAYDLVAMCSIFILTATINMLLVKPYKAYSTIFVWTSVVNIILYFLFYSQYTSIFLAPAVVTAIYLVYLCQKRRVQ